MKENKIPENYELAISMTAREFLDEEVDEWIQLVPEIKNKIKFVENTSEQMYKFEVWLPKELITKLNKAREEEIELKFKAVKKIDWKTLMDFNIKYWTTRNNPLRFGQQFLNEFYPEISCPEIFYEENAGKAVSLIVDKFVDLENLSLAELFGVK